MSEALYWIGVIGGWIVCAAWFDRGLRLMGFLRRHPPLTRHPLAEGPAEAAVCVVVAARNEAGAIEGCLCSLLVQDHPALRVVAVDDRSDDATGAIMDRLVETSDRLTVLHVTELPEGWLGKNHANAAGAQTAPALAADFLLFTDGDIFFAPDAIRRAVAVAQARQLDHLCLTPEVIAHSRLERAMCHFFGFCYLLKCKPWRIENPQALGAFSGVGAFNLVRRSVYQRVDGHERLRLEVLDDYKLGKLIKHAGGRSLLLDGRGEIRVRWQEGVFGFVRGLEKNAFAGCDFSVAATLLTIAMIVGVFVAPVVLAVAGEGGVRWAWLAALAAQIVVLGWLSRSLLDALVAPFCALVMIWTLLRSAWVTLRRGGVSWRGTFYSLAALRSGRV